MLAEFSIELASQLSQSTESFPVDFDAAWQWIGYTRKDSALDTLKSNFVTDLDFRFKPEMGTLAVPRPVIKYYLTVECFKMLGMMAGTVNGKEIRKYFLECERIAKSKVAESRKLPRLYGIDRANNLKTALTNVPDGHWTVLEQAIPLILQLELAGVPIDKFDLLDGSIGVCWSNYRVSKGLPRAEKLARYRHDDQRGTVPICVYPDSELGTFAGWLRTTYKQVYLPVYLESKYGSQLAIAA